MKRVVDKETVAHLWANQHQDEARTPTGNLYFNGKNIYSYGSHFLIAKHVENERGERAVLITKRTYSVTTTQQVHIVRAACSHKTQIFVPDPDLGRDELFNRWFSEIKSLADKLSKARKPEKYIYEIRGIVGEAERYADFFGYQLPEYLVEAGEIQNREEYTSVLSKEAAFRREQQEKQRIEKIKQQVKQLKDWRKFKAGRIYTADGFDYLRFNTKAGRVETSQRVEIPEPVAKRFYAFVLDTIAKGGCSDCNMKLMDMYEVIDINKEYIRVGCHKISLKEIRSFTKKLNW